MAVTAIVVGAALAVGGTVYSADQGRKAAHQQADANARASRIEALRERQDIVNRIRETRIAQASIENAGVNQGVQGSSPLVGAQVAIGSDTANNIGLQGQISQLRTEKLSLEQRAAQRLANARLGESFAQLGMEAATLGASKA